MNNCLSKPFSVFRHRAIGLLCLMLFLSCVTRSRTLSPTPPVDGADVVKITTTLIQIDVTVKDKNGKIVTDLSPDEIEV